MRDEQEMMDLIKNFAKYDERIRAAYMNGSRTNPHAPKDLFQDYDIVYVVTETTPFIENQGWISTFGELIMMQEPDKNEFGSEREFDFEKSYGFLMLFADGNRIDLHIQTIEVFTEEYGKDKLTLPLLDKDSLFPQIPAPSDEDYHVKRASKKAFDHYTSDFWWCLQNVAKGIWRDELPYAKQMFEYIIRESLDNMVEWWIGIAQDFQVSAGKSGKYFKKYLPEPYWEMYQNTYSNADPEQMWASVFAACELFRILSQEVAEYFDFHYPIDDDRKMTAFLERVKRLPADAEKID